MGELLPVILMISSCMEPRWQRQGWVHICIWGQNCGWLNIDWRKTCQAAPSCQEEGGKHGAGENPLLLLIEEDSCLRLLSLEVRWILAIYSRFLNIWRAWICYTLTSHIYVHLSIIFVYILLFNETRVFAAFRRRRLKLASLLDCAQLRFKSVRYENINWTNL